MATIVRMLERLADALLIALFLLIFALVLAQVVFRYVLNDPLVWSEELARLAFIWVAMLAWGLGSRRHSHIAITFVPDMLPRVPRLLLAVAVQILIIVLCALLVWHGWTLTARNIDLPMVTIDVPYAIVYVIVPVGAAIVICYALAEIHRLLAELGVLEAAR
jgi:TRAP-type C4-dicarboxylate transport system permease small subunit